MDKQTLPNIPAKIPMEKLQFVQMDMRIHDTKHTTKPIGYFMDAWIRFRKNKASVAAFVIIIALVIFALITPLITMYSMSDIDGVYSKVRPKITLFQNLGFWDGGYTLRLNNKYLIYLTAIDMGAEDGDGLGVTWEDGINSEYSTIMSMGEEFDANGVTYRNARVDSYMSVGFKYLTVTRAKYEEILAWEKESGIQVVYPMVNTRNQWCDVNNADDANFWYRHASNSSPVDAAGSRMNTVEQIMENGLIENYLRDSEGNILYYAQKDMNMLSIRVLYYNYYQYYMGHEPQFIFGTNAQGYDIMIRLSRGILLSLALAFSVAAVNLTIGTLYGAVEGYYGGVIDLVMERIVDVLGDVPFIVVAILFQLHLVNKGKVSTFVGLLFAYVLNGWIGTAYRVRTQFYRFKNQEYILAARTLGAGDFRLMFKHIFPNALGTIITASVLVIPGVIMTESFLSYLGILNFNSRTLTSLGTMLSNGQGTLATDPHIIFFPALIISLLMISFNLFGNGLRDAFNPSLRGTEE